ncbi:MULTISPECIES: hypothetical protein [Caballeronia]|uniref:Uncharacterized protein n=1 Tax=Caballeronia zhejiangensis TaxID=871203 RepID=A0A656QHG9_9BURK|nr:MULTISPECIES: hypothetical protein [Caballeronia]KDR28525.1 hypothetical protein BG60_11145 [Caballeronia zhejiangensis]MCE4547853.1 hypothetical protein [Caballeronia sp. PC1]MCE4575593.1 hypothetical protein [Caballeronia sp. CLC5]
MNKANSYHVALPGKWPLHTLEPVRSAQIRVMLNTIVTDAPSVWRRAPRRTWSDISRLVLSQLMTLDRLYPEAGILESPLRQMAVRFFAVNADPAIIGFGRRAGDAPSPAVTRLAQALRGTQRSNQHTVQQVQR